MATEFQQSVWKALTLIPRGKVTSYGTIADYLGTKAVRAVGSAVGKNPNAPEVPCHRVVKRDGRVGNYSGGDGVPTKIKLLLDEGVETKGDKILNFKEVFWRY